MKTIAINENRDGDNYSEDSNKTMTKKTEMKTITMKTVTKTMKRMLKIDTTVN